MPNWPILPGRPADRLESERLSSVSRTSEDAPGWNAIEVAFGALYGTQIPVHKAMVPGQAFGSPLQGISAYRAPDHWHFVTFGLSELWEKVPDSDPDLSGWGYELTLRVRAEAEPPQWAFDTLAGLARVTQESGTVYLPGDRVGLGVPQHVQGGSVIEGFAVATDPELPDRQTRNGRLGFHQLIRSSSAELERMRSMGTDTVLGEMRLKNPLLISEE